MCQCTPRRRYSWRSSSLVVGILLVGRVSRNRNTALLPSQSQCAFVCLRVLLLLAGNFGWCFGLEVTLVYLGILCLPSEAFLMLMKERFGMVAGFCFLFGTELKFSCLRPPKHHLCSMDSVHSFRVQTDANRGPLRQISRSKQRFRRCGSHKRHDRLHVCPNSLLFQDCAECIVEFLHLRCLLLRRKNLTGMMMATKSGAEDQILKMQFSNLQSESQNHTTHTTHSQREENHKQNSNNSFFFSFSIFPRSSCFFFFSFSFSLFFLSFFLTFSKNGATCAKDGSARF